MKHRWGKWEHKLAIFGGHHSSQKETLIDLETFGVAFHRPLFPHSIRSISLAAASKISTPDALSSRAPATSRFTDVFNCCGIRLERPLVSRKRAICRHSNHHILSVNLAMSVQPHSLTILLPATDSVTSELGQVAVLCFVNGHRHTESVTHPNFRLGESLKMLRFLALINAVLSSRRLFL